MKTRSIAVVAGMALAFHVSIAGVARGQFVPGHVFAGLAAGKICLEQAEFGGDRIWEIDPQTGEATLFVQIPEELCGFLTGLAFTPDGTRLRASSYLRNEILEFDSEGNMTVVLDATDGIACPWGLNNLAYDAGGNFYVVNQCTRTILRFPVDGGPPTIFADAGDGIGAGGAIAFAADGDLYLAHFFWENEVRRITPDGNASTFDGFGSIITPVAVTADESGHVYVGLETSEVFRYVAGDPESKELLAVVLSGGRYSMTMSPDQSKIYVNSWGVGTTGGLWSIDVLDGAVTLLAGLGEGLGVPAGIAVVPIVPPPIPTVSELGVIVMATLLLCAGTAVFGRRCSTAMGFLNRKRSRRRETMRSIRVHGAVRTHVAVVVVAVMGPYAASTASADPGGSFRGLGDLPGERFASIPVAVSADGSSVAGISSSALAPWYYEAFRWTEETGIVGLGNLGVLSASVAEAISADGSVVVGWRQEAQRPMEAFRWTDESGLLGLGFLSGNSSSWSFAVSADGRAVVGLNDFGQKAFRWTEANGMMALGDLPGGIRASVARDVSADGSVVVGTGYSEFDGRSRMEAFRWTEVGGILGLGGLGGDWASSDAVALSADGSVVVGASTTVSGGILVAVEAFRWTEKGGMVGLGDLPGGRFESKPSALSQDGSVVVGWSESSEGREIFRWTAEEGMVFLGDFPGGGFDSAALAVSANGSIVVGEVCTEGIVAHCSRMEAFIWDVSDGMRSLRDVLVNDFGLDLTGWTLTSALGISANGRTITGSGINPNGDSEAWMATLPAFGGSIPTVSEWGMVVMILLLLTVGTILIQRRLSFPGNLLCMRRDAKRGRGTVIDQAHHVRRATRIRSVERAGSKGSRA